MNKPSGKVLLIGWDAADWLIINRLLDQGEMPALKGLIENGVMGNITTLDPPLSPMLWTSIATGKHADKHGILGFAEPTPDHSAIRPISTSSRKVKAIWNILTQNNYRTHVVNWWPSYPAEPVNGIFVSDVFPKVSSIDMNDRKLPDDSVHPADLQNLFSHFRVHPLELSVSQLAPFIPALENADIPINKKIAILAGYLAEAATIQAAITLSIEQEDWDFAAVYWDTIDHLCHGFINYSPPQMEGVKDEDYELYQHVVDGVYRLMDLMLAHLLKLAGEDCTIIVTSDHGFQSGSLRQFHTPDEPSGPASHHRNVGVFCAKGPGIKKDEIVYGASLLDITPTILSIFGLPIGEDMDGKPLVEIFEKPEPIKTIPSWEKIPGECGMLPNEKMNLNTEQSNEAIKQLIALGYIEDPGPDITKAVETTIDDLDYNLAVVYFSTNRKFRAKPILEKLFDKYPNQGRFFFKLVDCFLDEGDIVSSENIIERFKLSDGIKTLKPEQIEFIKRRKVPAILTDDEKVVWIKENKQDPLVWDMQAKNNLIQLRILEADLLFIQGKPRKALQKYKDVEKEIPQSKTFYFQMGKAYLKTREWKDAEKKFADVLLFDPDHSNAHLGLGICKFNRGKFDEALEAFLTSVSLDFYNQISHFNIGRTLNEMGEYDKAANSFEISLRIDPNFGMARNALIDLYENVLIDPIKANAYRQKTEESLQLYGAKSNGDDSLIIKSKPKIFSSDPVIVVSGLPRSGTSMMMQMLAAGGLSVFTDNERKPDESNPNGYFEHAKVKQLIRNNRWLTEATGKVVKIVVPLLYQIPAALNYKVIFMMRDMNEIVESQHKMLVNNGRMNENRYSMGIEMTYKLYLEQLESWSSKNKNVDILLVNYLDAIKNPESTAIEISRFLNGELDLENMISAVQPELYRTKNLS